MGDGVGDREADGLEVGRVVGDVGDEGLKGGDCEATGFELVVGVGED